MMIYDFITLDKNNKQAVYKQLYQQIKKAIDNQYIAYDVKLPSIRKTALELDISRTTVENAYFQLCNEGYIINKPQRGYFVKRPPKKHIVTNSSNDQINYKYYFNADKIDISAADIPVWKKYVRNVLNREEDISSYGHPQGELCLRKAISSYIYATRGVISMDDNIVVGAGIQQLITLFCCIHKTRRVAIEYPGFSKAERIFKDFGVEVIYINDPLKPNITLENSNADVYFNIPSFKLKLSASLTYEDRERMLNWLKSSEDHYIIEDDFNGELKFSSRLLPALQNMNSEKIIYMGSFSKLLLPSVRIAYAVFPKQFINEYHKISAYYNQTASKIEQIALAEYIQDGYLEKHLRRLKKIYSEKSQILLNYVNKYFPDADANILESSLAVVFKYKGPLSDEEIEIQTKKYGIKIESVNNALIKLNFASIKIEDMEEAIKTLKQAI